MTQKMKQVAEDIAPLEDPITSDPAFQQTESRVAIWGHPLHAMTVAFPVALTFCAFGADVLYWWSGQERWAWAALWATGTAFLFGLLAGASGTMELLMVPGIRIRAAAWTHFVIAVMLLSLLGPELGVAADRIRVRHSPLGYPHVRLCGHCRGGNWVAWRQARF